MLLLLACGVSESPEGAASDDAATCEVPSMLDQFPQPLVFEDPYGEFPEADECLSSEHDAIVILGCPSEDDGAPSDCQLARVDLAVALSNQGFGDRFITSGAAAHNAFVEADALAELLLARGVADTQIWRDTQAEHTDENLYFSTQIMVENGWDDALVVSDDPGHLVMTAVSDSNCCVDLGRLSVFEFPIGSGESALVGHYALYPAAEQVTAAECDRIAGKGMSIMLDSRLACADDFQLE